MKLFNNNMSSVEAWRVLFTAVEGKKKEERDTIMAEYKKILPEIIKKEHADKTLLTSYQI